MTEKETRALKIVQSHVMYSAGLGLLPFPMVDSAGLVAIQLKLIRDLAGVYETPFSKEAGKSILASLLGGSAPFAGNTVGLLLRSIPFAGPALGLISISTFSAASTYAVGKVFILHFETGGTLPTFNVDKMRHYFREQLAKVRGAGGYPAGTQPEAAS